MTKKKNGTTDKEWAGLRRAADYVMEQAKNDFVRFGTGLGSTADRLKFVANELYKMANIAEVEEDKHTNGGTV